MWNLLCTKNTAHFLSRNDICSFCLQTRCFIPLTLFVFLPSLLLPLAIGLRRKEILFSDFEASQKSAAWLLFCAFNRSLLPVCGPPMQTISVCTSSAAVGGHYCPHFILHVTFLTLKRDPEVRECLGVCTQHVQHHVQTGQHLDSWTGKSPEKKCVQFSNWHIWTWPVSAAFNNMSSRQQALHLQTSSNPDLETPPLFKWVQKGLCEWRTLTKAIFAILETL